MEKRLQTKIRMLVIMGILLSLSAMKAYAADNFQVGAAFYDRLDAAAAVAPDGGIITMTQDVEIDYDVELNFNKTYTIDLSGNTLTGNGVGLGTLIVETGIVTIQNGTYIIDYQDGVGVEVSGGRATLENLIVDASSKTGADAIYVHGGNLTVRSGEYTASRLAVYVASGSGTIRTGHFKTLSTTLPCLLGYITLASGSEADVMNWLSNAKEVNIIRTPPPPTPGCFQVGEGFYDLPEAVSLVPEGGTITLIKDTTINSYYTLTTNKTYTIDLDGHTIQDEEDDNSMYKIFQIEAGTVTIKNGSIISNNLNAIEITGGTAILEELDVRAEYEGASTAVHVENGTAYILNGDYYGALNGVFCSTGTVTITSGHFACLNSDEGNYALHKWNHGDGQILLATGSYPSVVDYVCGGGNYSEGTKDVTITAGDFYPVTNITGVPTSATVGEPLTLTGTVAPGNATNKTIVWSVKDAGTTGAAVNFVTDTHYEYRDGALTEIEEIVWTLSTTAAGTAIVTATITDGTIPGVSYTQNFEITVNPATIYYGINIGTFTGGSVTADKATYEEDELVTLTISTETDYVLDQIKVYKTGDEASEITLSGTGNTRTFPMPAYDVTVIAAFSNPNMEAISTAKELIENATYIVSQSVANTEETVKSWLAGEINSLPGMSEKGIILSAENISLTDILPAVAGTSGSPSGINGNFTFTVSLEKGTSSLNTESKQGTITATLFIPPPTYTVSIDASTNGTVTADLTDAEEGETITLTISPAQGYELESISAYKTGEQTTSITLSGLENTRTFEMPAYGVTVTASFKKTQETLDSEAVKEAKTAIENVSYTVMQAIANTEPTVKAWLVTQINDLIASAGITVTESDITLSNFTAANDGTNGGFNFTVAIAKGSANAIVTKNGNSISAIPVCNVLVATMTNGSISTDKTTATQGETITLTISSAQGYELESISAYKTGEQTTNITLNGTANTRSFEMPAYGVTVVATFKKTQATLDSEAVTAAKTAIENGSYTVMQATANTESTVKAWLAGQINSLPGMNGTGIILSAANITLTNFVAAFAGTSTSPSGTNGNFTFTVSLAKGASSLNTESKPEVITATSFTPPATYMVSIAALINGTVTANPTNAEAGETITLTIEPVAGYELSAITAYRTGMRTTTIALLGTGNTRTFEMPTYNVTVSATFSKTQDQLDKEAVEVAVAAIEGGTYSVAQATANDEESVKIWLVGTLNALFGLSHNIQFRSSTSIVGDVTVTKTSFTSAIAGTESNSSGTNGSFTFIVTLTKGKTELKTLGVQGTIIATPFVAVKSIKLVLLDDLKVRITNTGNASTGKLTLVLSGTNVDSFTLPATVISSLAIDGETEITLIPHTNLAEGTYSAMLTVSGENITSVTLEITYIVTSTDITDISQTKLLKALIQNGVLYVSGLTVNKQWSVYNVSGTLIYQIVANNREVDISLPVRGVYIVVSGNDRIKVVY